MSSCSESIPAAWWTSTRRRAHIVVELGPQPPRWRVGLRREQPAGHDVGHDGRVDALLVAEWPRRRIREIERAQPDRPDAQREAEHAVNTGAQRRRREGRPPRRRHAGEVGLGHRSPERVRVDTRAFAQHELELLDHARRRRARGTERARPAGVVDEQDAGTPDLEQLDTRDARARGDRLPVVGGAAEVSEQPAETTELHQLTTATSP